MLADQPPSGRAPSTSKLGLRGLSAVIAPGRTASTVTALLAALLLPALVLAQVHVTADPSLGEVPFWRDSAGWWASDNTYLDGELQQNIGAYQGITHIEVSGSRIVETATRFYPPGKSSGFYSGGKVDADQGVELTTITTMEAAGEKGVATVVSVMPTTLAPKGVMTTTPLSPTVALQQVTDGASGQPSYHTLITLPSATQRYTAMFGIEAGNEGDQGKAASPALRGLAVFAGRRIAEEEVETLRGEFRQRNNVGAIVGPDDQGKLAVELIEPPRPQP